MHDNMRRPIFVCDELVMEILSWLPVKSLVRFMCVGKSFQSSISDPNFVKLHLRRSPKSVYFLLKYSPDSLNTHFILPSPVGSLLENPLSLVADHQSLEFDLGDEYEVVGTCNGLVCLVAELNNHEGCVFRLWNPATRKTFQDPQCFLALPQSDDLAVTVGFGYDNLSDTYKVVLIISTLDFDDGSLKFCEVKVCCISHDNCWRNIQSFSADPTTIYGCGVYLNSTLNWIALPLSHNHNHYSELDITFDELVIVSLDLGKETYTQFLLPRDLDGLHIDDFYSTGYEFNSDEGPSFGILKDCLSLFLRNNKTNHFSIWQMKEFGNQKSWIQSLNIDIADLQLDYCTPCSDLLPLIMLENGGVIMIDTTYHPMRAIFYDGKDNTLEHGQISYNTRWIYAKDYVQSLVSPRRY